MPPSPKLPASELETLSRAATLTESLLLTWLEKSSLDPPNVHEINAASQALWRLTAIRKTLASIAPDPHPGDGETDLPRYTYTPMQRGDGAQNEEEEYNEEDNENTDGDRQAEDYSFAPGSQENQCATNPAHETEHSNSQSVQAVTVPAINPIPRCPIISACSVKTSIRKGYDPGNANLLIGVHQSSSLHDEIFTSANHFRINNKSQKPFGAESTELLPLPSLSSLMSMLSFSEAFTVPKAPTPDRPP